MQFEDEVGLPVLRTDIRLNEAPPESDGSPTWTLYDPIANKYYKIGWLEFECLSRFKECKTLSELKKRIESETTLRPDEDSLKALIMFLVHSNLVLTSAHGAAEHFEKERTKRHKELWERILHGYLFFTLPLFKPQKFLERTFPYISFLFTKSFITLVFVLLGYGIFLTFQRFDEFTTTFMQYFSFEGVMLFIVATVLVKIVHELGHAYTATKYGVPVSVMGIAFMVLYPVLYCETSNVWKLQSRRQRFYIAAAGVMAETALASVALILWHAMTPGIAQSLCFMIAVVSLAASLAVNFNPLMRFDGYYIFSDLTGFDNLQDRSFALCRWRLRRALWGWKDPPPETLSRDKQKFLLTFGYAVWIYRFFLFTGIAILVYHVFFQPLGLFLFLVEIGFFIVFPILREVRVWVTKREEIAHSLHGKVVGAIVLGLIGLSFLPVQRSVEIPAVLYAGAYTKLYAPIPAQVEEILVQSGQEVQAGQVLFRLSSSQLDYNIQVVTHHLRALEDIRDTSQAMLELAQERVTLDSEIRTARKELEGYLTIRSLMEIRAPYNGVVRDLDTNLQPGQWIPVYAMLALVVGEGEPVLSGYAQEKDMARISKESKGVFYPEFSPMKSYKVVLNQIDEASTADIYWQELSSVHNGPLPSERNQHGNIKALPRYSVYPTQFSLENTADAHDFPDFIARGTVRLEAAPANAAKLLIKRIISVVVQEGGF